MNKSIEAQIIEDRLYFLSSDTIPQDITNASYFNIDEVLQYHPFHEDFGPLNLACIYKYIKSLKEVLDDLQKTNQVLYHHTSTDEKKKANSALLICCYQMIILGKSAFEAYAPLKNFMFRPFRDATSGVCKYECTILDCLLGLQYAMKLGWFDYNTFDIEKYEFYEKVENGDINEIIPDKLYAFSSPSAIAKDFYGNKLLQAEDYVPILKQLKIDAVVRLSDNDYKVNIFQKNGIAHYHFPFSQATAPPMSVVSGFFEAVQKHDRIAVHCKAGLGKTCTLIGCFAIKHYKFMAEHYIGWSRLCRPGSILGPQQYFLIEYEELLHESGKGSPLRKAAEEKLLHLKARSEDNDSDNDEENEIFFQSLRLPVPQKRKTQLNIEEQKKSIGKEPISGIVDEKKSKSKLLRKKTFGMERFQDKEFFK